MSLNADTSNIGACLVAPPDPKAKLLRPTQRRAAPPKKSNAGSAELPERAPSPVSRTIRIALDFVILHLQALSCCTRDENKTLLVLPYFSARSPSR
jgi:hypothetical protein